jgi:hypothetical protein
MNKTCEGPGKDGSGCERKCLSGNICFQCKPCKGLGKDGKGCKFTCLEGSICSICKRLPKGIIFVQMFVDKPNCKCGTPIRLMNAKECRTCARKTANEPTMCNCGKELKKNGATQCWKCEKFQHKSPTCLLCSSTITVKEKAFCARCDAKICE